MYVKGVVRKGQRTKWLTMHLRGHEVVLIQHVDLDEVAARSLVEKKVKAVINCAASMSGRYPNKGPAILLRHGIPLIDAPQTLFDKVSDGMTLEIKGNEIFLAGQFLARGVRFDEMLLQQKLASAKGGLTHELDLFLENTFYYALRDKDLVIHPPRFPDLPFSMLDKAALVVVRGPHDREDLLSIRGYIREEKPVIIAVDGGADVLLGVGLQPDIILGDMDSASDAALKSTNVRMVHAYPDGRAPGLKRVQDLGLRAHVISVPGTSEDLALLLADVKGSAYVVAVGTHSGLIDFLEKGRQGMGSTLLVRMKLGSRLMDAKGVNRLYQERFHWSWLIWILLSVLPLLLVTVLYSKGILHYLQLSLLELRVRFGY